MGSFRVENSEPLFGFSWASSAQAGPLPQDSRPVTFHAVTGVELLQAFLQPKDGSVSVSSQTLTHLRKNLVKQNTTLRQAFASLSPSDQAEITRHVGRDALSEIFSFSETNSLADYWRGALSLGSGLSRDLSPERMAVGANILGMILEGTGVPQDVKAEAGRRLAVLKGDGSFTEQLIQMGRGVVGGLKAEPEMLLPMVLAGPVGRTVNYWKTAEYAAALERGVMLSRGLRLRAAAWAFAAENTVFSMGGRGLRALSGELTTSIQEDFLRSGATLGILHGASHVAGGLFAGAVRGLRGTATPLNGAWRAGQVVTSQLGVYGGLVAEHTLLSPESHDPWMAGLNGYLNLTAAMWVGRAALNTVWKGFDAKHQALTARLHELSRVRGQGGVWTTIQEGFEILSNGGFPPGAAPQAVIGNFSGASRTSSSVDELRVVKAKDSDPLVGSTLPPIPEDPRLSPQERIRRYSRYFFVPIEREDVARLEASVATIEQRTDLEALEPIHHLHELGPCLAKGWDPLIVLLSPRLPEISLLSVLMKSMNRIDFPLLTHQRLNPSGDVQQVLFNKQEYATSELILELVLPFSRLTQWIAENIHELPNNAYGALNHFSSKSLLALFQQAHQWGSFKVLHLPTVNSESSLFPRIKTELQQLGFPESVGVEAQGPFYESPVDYRRVRNLPEISEQKLDAIAQWAAPLSADVSRARQALIGAWMDALGSRGNDYAFIEASVGDHPMTQALVSEIQKQASKKRPPAVMLSPWDRFAENHGVGLDIWMGKALGHGIIEGGISEVADVVFKDARSSPALIERIQWVETYGGQVGETLIREYLDHPTPAVRRQALHSLLNRDSAVTMAQLSRMLQPYGGDIQEPLSPPELGETLLLLQAMERWGKNSETVPQETITLLRTLQEHPVEPIAAAAEATAIALHIMPPEKSKYQERPTLENLVPPSYQSLAQWEPGTRLAAASAQLRLGEAEAMQLGLPVYQEMFAHPNAEFRQRAVENLLELFDLEAPTARAVYDQLTARDEALIAGLLHDPNPTVRRLAMKLKDQMDPDWDQVIWQSWDRQNPDKRE
jgi:hypothetical protein